jgi:hypothetical protein
MRACELRAGICERRSLEVVVISFFSKENLKLGGIIKFFRVYFF